MRNGCSLSSVPSVFPDICSGEARLAGSKRSVTSTVPSPRRIGGKVRKGGCPHPNPPPCAGEGTAHYLLAIINSDSLATEVDPLMPKGQFGSRDLQKHLWKLPIPEFDPSDALHAAIANAGEAAASGVTTQLEQLREERPKLTVTVARRELRNWLRVSPEGTAVEQAVGELLGSGR